MMQRSSDSVRKELGKEQSISSSEGWATIQWRKMHRNGAVHFWQSKYQFNFNPWPKTILMPLLKSGTALSKLF
jgi:hypothetical protein